jgi:sulfite reductase (ferredoxin)
VLNTAKAVLIGENIKTNTQAGIINDFDQYFVKTGLIELDTSFADLIFQIKKNKASETFARAYLSQAIAFYKTIDTLRSNAIKNES